ncbi:MAG: tyrP-A [Francisellaceae bacterium]|nr:tyrP-A [Francisellaceae bacterium]
MKKFIMQIFSKTTGVALMVAGTCIGAGMLGLPIKTGALGLKYSLLLFIIVWALMGFSALLMLEASLWSKKETNLFSMMNQVFGVYGKFFTTLICILFLYSLMAAYTSGGSTLTKELLSNLFSPSSSYNWGFILFVCPFALVVFFGAKWVDFLNRFFMAGLFIAYCILLSGLKLKKMDAPLVGDLTYALFPLPIIVTSFGFHLLIPSLKTYLSSNKKLLQRAIWIGSLIPLIIYSLWEIIILRNIPLVGPGNLLNMLNSHSNPAELIMHKMAGNNLLMARAIALFSFFALVTSFMGVALGLSDFLIDLFQCKHKLSNRFWICILTFIPPVIYAIYFPKGFLLALNYAGIFAAILLIVTPAVMVWKGRYYLDLSKNYRVFGGKCLLFLVIMFGVFVMTVEILSQLNYLPIPSFTT